MHKKYLHSFITFWLNYWCHMYYFNNVLPYDLSGPWTYQLCYCLWEGQKALKFHHNYLNLCSEDEWRSYRLRVTWGWVINDRIFIFGWTNPFISAPLVSANTIIAHLSFHLSVYLSQPVSLSVCSSVHPSIHSFIHPYLCDSSDIMRTFVMLFKDIHYLLESFLRRNIDSVFTEIRLQCFLLNY